MKSRRGVCCPLRKSPRYSWNPTPVKPRRRASGTERNLLQRLGAYPPAGERRIHLYGLGSQARKVHYPVVAPVKRQPDKYMKFSQLLLYIF